MRTCCASSHFCLPFSRCNRLVLTLYARFAFESAEVQFMDWHLRLVVRFSPRDRFGVAVTVLQAVMLRRQSWSFVTLVTSDRPWRRSTGPPGERVDGGSTSAPAVCRQREALVSHDWSQTG